MNRFVDYMIPSRGNGMEMLVFPTTIYDCSCGCAAKIAHTPDGRGRWADGGVILDDVKPDLVLPDLALPDWFCGV